MEEFLSKYKNVLLEDQGKALTIEVLSLIASNLSDVQEMPKDEGDARINNVKEFIFSYKKALKN